jgi:hypothetical protein
VYADRLRVALPNAHQFATAMPDIPHPTWRRVVEALGVAELPEQPALQIQPPEA